MNLFNDLKKYYLTGISDTERLQLLMGYAFRYVIPKLKNKLTDESIFELIITKFKYFPTVAELYNIIPNERTDDTSEQIKKQNIDHIKYMKREYDIKISKGEATEKQRDELIKSMMEDYNVTTIAF